LAAAAQAQKDANNFLNVDVAGASLPETGSENTSIFGLIGLAIAGFGRFLVRPFKKEN
jgi:LPXTG-motif cell wall-anchored protein